MVMRRSIVFSPSWTSKRVEFVPMSMAATGASVMVMVLGEIVTVLVGGEPFGHPTAYWIVAACEIPGVVGVQALDAAAGTADAGGRPRTVVIRRHCGVGSSR